jgi:hypothetical protein
MIRFRILYYSVYIKKEKVEKKKKRYIKLAFGMNYLLTLVLESVSKYSTLIIVTQRKKTNKQKKVFNWLNGL